MPSPEASLVVIECPHCGTRYQVAYAAIGAKGRTVACAHCQKSWEAHAERPRPKVVPRPKGFGELAEEALDEKFQLEEQRHKAKHEAAAKAEVDARAAKAKAREEAIAGSTVRAAAKAADRDAAKAGATANAGPVPPGVEALVDAADADRSPRTPDHQRTLDDLKAVVHPNHPLDPAARRRQQHEFSLRQKSLYSSLPMARLRRLSRLAAIATIALVLGGGVALRGPIVQQFPQLAGVYAAMGLGVNVIGLEFGDVRTLKSLQQGAEVLVVNGTIRSVASGEVVLPQVIVTLVGPKGDALYEWSMVPKATELEPGETLPFETQLSSPPALATGVRLTFSTGRSQSRPVDAMPVMQAPTAAPAIALPAATGAIDRADGKQ